MRMAVVASPQAVVICLNLPGYETASPQAKIPGRLVDISNPTLTRPSSVSSRFQRFRSSRSADIPMLMTARSVGTTISFPSCESVTDSTLSLPLIDTRLADMIVLTPLFSSSLTVPSSALKSALRWTIVVSVTESATRAMSMALLPPPNMVTLLPTSSSFAGRR